MRFKKTFVARVDDYHFVQAGVADHHLPSIICG